MGRLALQKGRLALRMGRLALQVGRLALQKGRLALRGDVWRYGKGRLALQEGRLALQKRTSGATANVFGATTHIPAETIFSLSNLSPVVSHEMGPTSIPRFPA